MKKSYYFIRDDIMWIFLLSFIVLIRIRTIQGQLPTIDSRCYLEGGGVAENFLASEDVAVGTVVGTLRINGDADLENGNIKLSLRERDSPVQIAPGTKDLILTVPLDKEGVRGPSSVYVNVICDRRLSTDPSFVIPVNIRVTDVNDNAPQWIGAPYTLTLSEVTVPETRILQGARAVDLDQQGPFSTVEYQTLPGPHSDYVSFVSPLEGTLVLKKPLDYETLRNFTVKLRAQDQGTPPKFTDTTLRIIVTDADDQNPKFLKESYRGELPANSSLGEVKIYPEPIRAIDQDEGLQAELKYSINPSSDSRFFSINPVVGTINLITPIESQGFSQITLVIKATQHDNPDRYALATLIISRREVKNFGKSLEFIQPVFHAKVREDLGVGSRVLALPTNRPGQGLNYKIIEPEQAQYFYIGSFGELILRRELDYEKAINHIFHVIASDGLSNASTKVQIDVVDVNDWDPRFRETHYQFNIPIMNNFDKPMALGKLEVADGDRNDRINLHLRGIHSRLFSVDSRGYLWLKAEKPNTTVMHLMAIATDTGSPSRNSSVPVTVAFEVPPIKESQWAPGMLGAFATVLGLFAVVVILMSIYIIKSKSQKSRNRIHSHSQSTHSAANLVSNEKVINGLHLGGGNMSLGSPRNGHGGSGSSLSAGASTILAATLEREQQREREHENYTATVRSIISRASIQNHRGNGGIHSNDDDDDDLEHDSISNSDTTRINWGAIGDDTNTKENNNINILGGLPPKGKKLSWVNDDLRQQNNNTSKTDINASTDTIGSMENNLTVYF